MSQRINVPETKTTEPAISQKIRNGERISEEEALLLLQEADLLELGQLAHLVRQRMHPDNLVSFIIDRNINYTNICISGCQFCAFYRRQGHPETYLLSKEEIFRRIQETIDLGGTQIMLQGGLHPELHLDYFVNLFQEIKKRFPVTIHSLSPPEIVHIARNSGLSIRDVLVELKRAGLDSLPGGGAEILVDEIRAQISPRKATTEEWLEVMETAHQVGLKSTATMMMGTIESLRDRTAHLSKIRALQDRTGGFRAFIPWTFQPRHTALEKKVGGRPTSSIDYLRTLAVSRIFLDNVKHVQGSWVTQGKGIGQLTLFFGGNDLGSIMIEENVVKAAGVSYKMTVEEMVDLIRSAGFTPALRNTEYKILKVY
ncbi:cyclic dehypoxanthinyl futalosine synthase [Candidatus Hakubella thermalkaliphila]|uniref:Cyclic dehypoxanthine futalosine synthase n=1 Tax=Candidatus Hakubella thermalkaliphila TaxID=2754717 RepID=A0A6V8P547_9ACTN|nr:cyclic dehypoxanthinyl futalosine synthase [Candidatus Hakubella thermalkaliphila]GFP25166.1 cyclic dehypoxanthinyl futalosine synthase [Candidatus Hakubella thermalkaliphila]GFP27020.1 cyclic dehypoxanthinyl futalosine synthase [Candidatus Hakubella thermalkaliphila]GFP34696.1 cyclic dehypoxanthinyl futalosine synthase [Candidatus Hakubella thermalkaliphila]